MHNNISTIYKKLSYILVLLRLDSISLTSWLLNIVSDYSILHFVSQRLRSIFFLHFGVATEIFRENVIKKIIIDCTEVC